MSPSVGHCLWMQGCKQMWDLGGFEVPNGLYSSFLQRNVFNSCVCLGISYPPAGFLNLPGASIACSRLWVSAVRPGLVLAQPSTVWSTRATFPNKPPQWKNHSAIVALSVEYWPSQVGFAHHSFMKSDMMLFLQFCWIQNLHQLLYMILSVLRTDHIEEETFVCFCFRNVHLAVSARWGHAPCSWLEALHCWVGRQMYWKSPALQESTSKKVPLLWSNLNFHLSSEAGNLGNNLDGTADDHGYVQSGRQVLEKRQEIKLNNNTQLIK